ncbi:ABC transporter ATP-binding protein [Bradyrhizobium rifense]|uniref:ABC transporter ATP-binding protein n=1 Tax=Bradyrhizobium rifense TaxID=515499 RepID=A0A5D3JXZ4_9BRAD|nr:ABC transporter ATP-binding protein [Bradyrhizobium rifense]TYL85376.1 ABC transporter ATP-binding protein [Bradyrhizobium rifense]
MNDIVLSLEGITKRFGSLIANDDVTLNLRRGELLALLGENGAGKTTLMNILFGHYAADAGRVVAFGRELQPGRPRAAIDAGIGMVHQHFALAANLTVLENIVAGTESIGRLRGDWRRARVKLTEIARRFGLAIDPDARVGDLSVGERQRVEILKALYRDARILILDEPTAVLTPQEAEKLFDTLRVMAAKGLSLIFISHKLHEILAAADRIVVLRGGKVTAERITANTNKNELAELMVGRPVTRPAREAQQPGALVMRAENVCVAGFRPLSDISFELRAGETLGIIGVSGNGQSTLGRLLGGLVKPTAGSFELLGATVTEPTPASFVACGVARIPEDRNVDGTVSDMTLWENSVLERIGERRFSAFGLVRRSGARAFAKTIIERFDVRGGVPDTPIRLLSGGNMQKLILGRNLLTSPRILVAAQPTRGLDEGAVAAVHAEILAARRAGAGVLLISEDLDEILQLADRVQAIANGRLSPSIPIEDAEPRRLGLMMAGAWSEMA